MINKLQYGGGDIELNTDLKAIIIEINFNGDVKIYPLLGVDYDVTIFKNKIIIINKLYKDINKPLRFKYRGYLKINSARLTDKDKNIYNCNIRLANIDLWPRMNSLWSSNENEYKSYNKTMTHKPQKIGRRL